MDISQFFTGQTLEVDCPNCNRTILFDASLAFQENSVVTCSKCKEHINLENSKAKKDAEQAVEDIKKLFG